MRATFVGALFTVAVILAGCANPANRVTMDDYTDQCGTSENSGHFDVALEACRRAWINSRIGNLGTELESRALYNYGRVARKAMKLDDAEEALKRSLELQASIDGATSEKVGRRLAELALTKIFQRKSEDGIAYVERLIAMASAYSGAERKAVCGVLFGYIEDLPLPKFGAKRSEFETAAKAMACSRAEFK